MNPGDMQHSGPHCTYWLSGELSLNIIAWCYGEEVIRYHIESIDYGKWYVKS